MAAVSSYSRELGLSLKLYVISILFSKTFYFVCHKKTKQNKEQDTKTLEQERESKNYLNNNKRSLKDTDCFNRNFCITLVLTSQWEAGLLRRGVCVVLRDFGPDGTFGFPPASFLLLDTETQGLKVGFSRSLKKKSD